MNSTNVIKTCDSVDQLLKAGLTKIDSLKAEIDALPENCELKLVLKIHQANIKKSIHDMEARLGNIVKAIRKNQPTINTYNSNNEKN